MSETNIGTCKYCGQTRVVETVGEVSQERRDDIATDLCSCGAAQAEKRARERREHIASFINDNFDDFDGKIIREIIDQVEQQIWKSVTINMDEDRSCKIWLDSDAYLNMRIKALTTKELKV